MNLFWNRQLVIATKHGKEKVISPLLTKHLKVLPFTDHHLDTDSLGTFTGEIKRKMSPSDAAKEKCLLATKLTTCDLAIASEGSFGPHPVYGFIPVNEELLVFMDFKNNIQIEQKIVSIKTNFNSRLISTQKELLEFSKQVNFPSHALILRKINPDNKEEIIKGITDKNNLLFHFQKIKDQLSEIRVETDMRAMYNPTRMKVIKDCAVLLVNKIKSLCPQCNFPGYGVVSSKGGLPCSQCTLPTKSVLSNTYCCKNCSYTEDKLYPNKKITEEPTFCDFCNP